MYACVYILTTYMIYNNNNNITIIHKKPKRRRWRWWCTKTKTKPGPPSGKICLNKKYLLEQKISTVSFQKTKNFTSGYSTTTPTNTTTTTQTPLKINSHKMHSKKKKKNFGPSVRLTVRLIHSTDNTKTTSLKSCNSENYEVNVKCHALTGFWDVFKICLTPNGQLQQPQK